MVWERADEKEFDSKSSKNQSGSRADNGMLSIKGVSGMSNPMALLQKSSTCGDSRYEHDGNSRVARTVI